MTEKLYEKNGSLLTFDATVLSFEPTKTGFAVTLDRTAFFPGGGGQECDVGKLGGVPVTGAALDYDRVIHFTSAPLTVGSTVTGEVDRSVRFPRMQCHTAEHIVSGRWTWCGSQWRIRSVRRAFGSWPPGNGG